jgi:hypothetical protein
MARVAVLEPDDDPRRGPRLPLAQAAREALFADLIGRRLEVRRDGPEMLARIVPGERITRVLGWLRQAPLRG